MKPATTVTMILLLIVSVGHLIRWILRVPVTIGEELVPMWVSLIGTIVPAALAFGLRREHRSA